MKRLSVVLVFLLNFFLSFGQKTIVPSKSLWAPEGIKIDGKPLEWNNKYEGYNSVNHLFYTVSNDSENLYLIIHTTESNTINKIYVGGVSFIVMPFKNSNSQQVSLTYPIKANNNGVYLHAKHDYDEYKKDSITNSQKIIDLIELKNQQFESSYKEIMVNGVKSLNDPVISIYNDEGIKVISSFDNSFSYTCEIALPLKYLQDVLSNSNGKLKYTIRLNGLYREGSTHPVPPTPHTFRPDGSEFIDMNQLYVSSPTDFSGEYFLAKK